MNKHYDGWHNNMGSKRSFKKAAEELERKVKVALQAKSIMHIGILCRKNEEYRTYYWELTKVNLENGPEQLRVELNGKIFSSAQLSIILRRIENYYLASFGKEMIHVDYFYEIPKRSKQLNQEVKMTQKQNPVASKCEQCVYAFALSTSKKLVKCIAPGNFCLMDTTNDCPHYEEEKAVENEA